MTYDQWKTTDPRDYEPEAEEQDDQSELELVYESLHSAQHERDQALKRIRALEADLEEYLEYFKDKYDVSDGDYGEPAPNKEMQLGQMIDETLYGIRF